TGQVVVCLPAHSRRELRSGETPVSWLRSGRDGALYRFQGRSPEGECRSNLHSWGVGPGQVRLGGTWPPADEEPAPSAGPRASTDFETTLPVFLDPGL